MKAWRLDLLIALGALLVSALTASAAIYQSKVFSDQLSATVWPYLSFSNTLGATSFQMGLENDGAGPAIISGAQLFVDGKPMPTWQRALQAFHLKRDAHVSFLLSSVGPGEVIRPGATAIVIRARGPAMTSRVRAVLGRFAFSVYYCSMLNRCWVVKLNSTAQPAEVNPATIPRTGIQPQ